MVLTAERRSVPWAAPELAEYVRIAKSPKKDLIMEHFRLNLKRLSGDTKDPDKLAEARAAAMLLLPKGSEVVRTSWLKGI